MTIRWWYLVAIAWVLGVPTASVADIGPAVFPGNGHQYILVESGLYWWDAVADCESRGAYLVSITSQEENDFVYDSLASQAAPGSNVWIGGTDYWQEGVWTWVSGEPWVYENWAPPEPNETGPEDFAEFGITWGYGSQWNDIEYNQYLSPYICEFDAIETPVDLVSFEATAEDDSVLLTWETATERDMAGFHLLRSRVEAGGYERIAGSLIPAEGDAFSGATYEFVDDDVTDGTYYYKLEAVDLTGASEFFGPVDATIESEPQFGCGAVH